MVSFVIIGNCQTDTIQFLIERMIPDASTEIMDISRREARKPEFIQCMLPTICQADYVLHQTAILDSQALSILKSAVSGKLIGIANMYFRGLHPDSCLIGSYDQRKSVFSACHSVIILDAFMSGRTEKQALAAFNHENFERLGLWQAWESSINELKKRDKELDFPVADFVDTYCREFPGFFSINHPTIGLMHDYMAKVFRLIGIKYRTFNAASCKDPLREHNLIPILDLVAEKNHLPYRTSQLWGFGFPYTRFLDLDAIITQFYAEYRRLSASQLFVSSPEDMKESFLHSDALKKLVDPEHKKQSLFFRFLNRFL